MPYRFSDIRHCLIFFTRFPAGSATSNRSLAAALWAAPLAGTAVAVATAGIYWLATSAGLSPPIAALLALAAGVISTGGLHEDGLADLADSLGGGPDRARRLQIMRDSRIGGFGAMALVFSIGLRAAALTALAAPDLVFAALIAAHALSRGILPAVMTLFPTATAEGLAASVGRVSHSTAAVAVALAFTMAAVALGPGEALAMLGLGIVVALAVGAHARTRLGGYTGDVLGAAQQLSEITIILAVTGASL